MKLVTAPALVLSAQARRAEPRDRTLPAILDDMVATMRDAGGIGLAAPQVGLSLRLCVVLQGEQVFRMVNPEIVKQSGAAMAVEGCLSLPGEGYQVWRSETVTVQWFDENGRRHRCRFFGRVARCVQHELDHLEGMLIVDRHLLQRRAAEAIAAESAQAARVAVL